MRIRNLPARRRPSSSPRPAYRADPSSARPALPASAPATPAPRRPRRRPSSCRCRWRRVVKTIDPDRRSTMRPAPSRSAASPCRPRSRPIWSSSACPTAPTSRPATCSTGSTRATSRSRSTRPSRRSSATRPRSTTSGRTSTAATSSSKSGCLAKDTLRPAHQQHAPGRGGARRPTARRMRAAQLNLDYTEIRAPFPGRLGRNQAPIGTLVGRRHDGAEHAGAARSRSTSPSTRARPISSASQKARARRHGRGRRHGAGRGRAAPQGRTDLPRQQPSTARPAPSRRGPRSPTPTSACCPGNMCGCGVHLREQPDALLVPQVAIGSSQLGKYVYVVGEGDKVEQRLVTLGPTRGRARGGAERRRRGRPRHHRQPAEDRPRHAGEAASGGRSAAVVSGRARARGRAAGSAHEHRRRCRWGRRDEPEGRRPRPPRAHDVVVERQVAAGHGGRADADRGLEATGRPASGSPPQPAAASSVADRGFPVTSSACRPGRDRTPRGIGHARACWRDGGQDGLHHRAGGRHDGGDHPVSATAVAIRAR